MPYDSGHYSWRWTDKCKGMIVKYIKLGSLNIIQSLNSLNKEIRDDFVRTIIETISGSSFITLNKNPRVSIVIIIVKLQ